MKKLLILTTILISLTFTCFGGSTLVLEHESREIVVAEYKRIMNNGPLEKNIVKLPNGRWQIKVQVKGSHTIGRLFSK